MFLRRLFPSIGNANPSAVPAVPDREHVRQVIECAYELALSRPPTDAEATAALASVGSGDRGLVEVLETLGALKAAGAPVYDYRADPDLAPFLSPEVLQRSEKLRLGGGLSHGSYDQLYRERFDSGRPLIVGQAEYGPQHKERFWEMFNAATYLLHGRSSPRVIEFGTSEFSAIFQPLLPGVELHLSDRPVAPDYIGFTQEVARRIAACKLYQAIDLEGGTRAILESGLETGSYDLVVFAETLEHLDVNPIELLEALIRLLKEDGFLYLTTPNFFRRENRERLARFENPQEIYPAADGNWDEHHHHREYAAKELFRFIEAAGGQTHAFYFSACWDTEPLPQEHERGNLVFVIQRRRN
jgi:SAM-dependent methyltransferase